MRKIVPALLLALGALGVLLYWAHVRRATTVAPHTKIHVLKTDTSVWTYLPVTAIYDGQTWTYPNDHIYVELEDDMTVTLAGKYNLAVSEGRLLVNGHEVANGTLNVYLTDEGQVERDTFIRTFE